MYLFFDREAHRYYIKNADDEPYIPIPSVTQIVNIGKYFPNDSIALQRGTFVHEIAEKIDKGHEIPSVDEDTKTMLENYTSFIHSHLQPVYTHIEVPLLGNINGLYYAGTADRIGSILVSGKEVPCIIDIKTGVKSKTYAMQLAAYAHAYYNDKRKEAYGVIVYLKKKLAIDIIPPSAMEEALKAFVARLQLFYVQERYSG